MLLNFIETIKKNFSVKTSISSRKISRIQDPCGDNFEEVTSYVLDKNAELYRRLS